MGTVETLRPKNQQSVRRQGHRVLVAIALLALVLVIMGTCALERKKHPQEAGPGAREVISQKLYELGQPQNWRGH